MSQAIGLRLLARFPVWASVGAAHYFFAGLLVIFRRNAAFRKQAFRIIGIGLVMIVPSTRNKLLDVSKTV